MIKQINITLIGAPGSGKGTYGSLLAKRLHANFVSVGDLLRDHVQRNTSIGKEAREAQRRGELVNDSVVIQAIRDYLESRTIDPPDPFIIDGFPRMLDQATWISPISTTQKEQDNNHCCPEAMRVSYAVSLQVPDTICQKKALGRRICSLCNKTNINVCDIHEDGYRMPPMLPQNCPFPSCNEQNWKQRNDDSPEIVLRRMQHFRSTMDPLLSYYENQRRLIKFYPFNGVDDLPVLEKLVRETIEFGQTSL